MTIRITAVLLAGAFLAGTALASDRMCEADAAEKDRPQWQRIAGPAEFTGRDVARPIQFAGYLWLSNGYRDSKTVARDLWRSKDGRKWELVNGSTPYDPYAGVAAFKGAIYAAKTSVWRSVDGRNWALVQPSGPLKDQDSLPFLRVFKNRLFLFAEDQVWSSADGVAWRREPDAPYGPRTRYAVTVAGDALYVLGGARQDRSLDQSGAMYPDWASYNDVWKTKDGRRWERIARSAPWTARMWPSVVSHKGRLVLVGGFDNLNKANLGDTWVSRDGRNWCRLAADEIEPRHWPSLFSLGDDIVLAAGNAWPVMNDVWRLHLP